MKIDAHPRLEPTTPVIACYVHAAFSFLRPVIKSRARQRKGSVHHPGHASMAALPLNGRTSSLPGSRRPVISHDPAVTGNIVSRASRLKPPCLSPASLEHSPGCCSGRTQRCSGVTCGAGSTEGPMCELGIEPRGGPKPDPMSNHWPLGETWETEGPTPHSIERVLHSVTLSCNEHQ